MNRFPFLYCTLIWLVLYNAIAYSVLDLLCSEGPYFTPEMWRLAEAFFKTSLIVAPFMGIMTGAAYRADQRAKAEEHRLDEIERRPLQPFSYR